ncbi:MAG: DUF4434 domain-containing protein [Clostridia bacterium]|nr:DUF4434 domain-containing protein [Clostridia bacterium]
MKGKYPITGTFIDEITYDIPSSNWTEEQWAADLDNMKAVGMDTLVFIRGAFDGKCLYPSKIFPTLKEENEDFAGFIMREAAKRDMQVYLGMYISSVTWRVGDYKNEIAKNKLFLAEALERYGDISSFKGWYIPHEGSRNTFNLKETMQGLAALCKDKTPEKSVMISPFYQGRGLNDGAVFSPERTVDEWNNIWEKSGKDIDICAFQDGTASLDEYEGYLAAMKKLCKAHNIRFWTNVETFERDVRRMYYPIPFDVLRKKLAIAEGYVEKSITFEFSHFLSPQSIYPSARNLNTLYRNYYGK